MVTCVSKRDFLILQRLTEGTLKTDSKTGEVFSSLANGYKLTGLIKLNGSINNEGYIQLGLYINNKMVTVPVHKVIWLSVNKYIPEGFVVDHINHNRRDNRITNLRLLTRKENSIENGILNFDDATKIRDMFSSGKYTQTDIAREFRVTQFAIYSILKNRTHYDALYIPILISDSRIGKIIIYQNLQTMI